MTTKKEATRLRLLEAGTRMAINKGALPHMDVRLTEVLAEVGLTTGAAYNIWGSQDEFRVDLAIEIANAFSERELLSEDDKPSLDSNKTLAEYLEHMATLLLSCALDDMAFLLPLRFWGVRSVPEPIVARIAEGFQTRDDALGEIIAAMCEHYALTTRTDRSIEEVATMALGCLDGTVLRTRLCCDEATTKKNAELLAVMLGAIVQSAMVPVESSSEHNAWNIEERRPETALAC